MNENIENQKSTFLLSIFGVVIIGVASISIVKAKNPQFELAPKKELVKFDKSRGENSYDYIPEELAQKHQAAIQKIDEIIVRDLPAEGITSTAENFSLNYYVHIIKIGVLPYVQDEQLAKDIEAFTDEAWEEYLFNEEKINDSVPSALR